MENKSITDLLKKLTESVTQFNADSVSSYSKEIVSVIKNNIASHPEGFVRELSKAVDSFDIKEAEELCHKLDSHLRKRDEPYPERESKKILTLLRRKRYFVLMSRVANILIQTGQDAPNIRRQYAQALLDLGEISAALDVLEILVKQCGQLKNAKEHAEAKGLTGRAYKQIYMDSFAFGKPGQLVGQSLKSSIESYLSVYKQDKSLLWHGINSAALIERAKRDHISLGRSTPQAKTIAKQILNQVKSNKTPSLWDFGTAAEACLVLKDYQQCLEWIIKYTDDNPFADAFEYASTLRQFQEVWQLEENFKEQAKILNVLKAALLEQSGGEIEVQNSSNGITAITEIETDAHYEQILGRDRYKTFIWYRRGLERASAVIKIFDRDGNGFGTGFIVKGANICKKLGENLVVITNAHVLSNDPQEQSGVPAAIPPKEAEFCFEAVDPIKKYKAGKVLFSSSRNELDCTILSFQGPMPDVKPYPIANRLPILNKNQRVYIIGHPRAGKLSYSLMDNLVLDYEGSKIHYRAPTEGGSSGSPVFNESWDLLGLHHSGGMNMKKLNNKPGTYPANEGIYIQSICEAVSKYHDTQSEF